MAGELAPAQVQVDMLQQPFGLKNFGPLSVVAGPELFTAEAPPPMVQSPPRLPLVGDIVLAIPRAAVAGFDAAAGFEI